MNKLRELFERACCVRCLTGWDPHDCGLSGRLGSDDRSLRLAVSADAALHRM